MFSVVVIWMILLTPAFICHHLLKGNEELILKIERAIHFFYVYVPPIYIVYFYKITNTRIRFVVPLTFALSFILSLSTLTDYYFNGLYTYSWGYIAKGGIAFQIFGFYGTVVILHFIVLFIIKMRTEKNPVIRLKYKYLHMSFIMGFLLTVSNIPAINGIDFYPFGTMVFIPLGFLGYGILSHRLMDIRSVLHVTFIWVVTSSLILVPNILLFYFMYSYLIKIVPAFLFFIILVWFAVNLVYIRLVQPLINEIFNRRKYDLRSIESNFINNISSLKTLGELLVQVRGIIKKSLSLKMVDVYLRDKESNVFMSMEKINHDVDPGLIPWLAGHDGLLDKGTVDIHEDYRDVRGGLAGLFAMDDANFLVPLVNNNELLGVIAMSEKPDLRPLTDDEVQFINNLRNATSISLGNSILYTNLSTLKDSLEIKVMERTAELQAANEEMAVMNENLVKTRDSLWGEMQLAKKIQTMLLPKHPLINGYEISAFMQPADEVGGDYYDIINVEGMDWVVIGDVSGHGVPAGLIMMMVQTSIHTVLEGSPGLMPNMLLTHVNKVISENIELLDEDKYMTITVLACLRDGRLYHSGLHQDILIYRAARRKVDKVVTNGIWLGLNDVQWSPSENSSISMESGDVLLLYTDGITEAWLRSAPQTTGMRLEEDMFGVERLERTLEKNGKESTDVIKDSILRELREYQYDDDLTMVVMKRID